MGKKSSNLATRVDPSLLNDIQKLAIEKFGSNFSNAVRSLLLDGLEIQKLREIATDDKNQSEFEQRLNLLLVAKDIRTGLSRFTKDELRLIQKYLKVELEAKEADLIKQLR